MNIVLTALLTGLVTGTLMLGGLILLYLFTKNRISRVVDAFIRQPDEKTPSPLATWVDQTAQLAAAHLVMQVKTTLMGLASVDAKNARKEAAGQMLDKMPALAGLVNIIPGAKRLFRNPEMLSLAGSLLSRIGAGGNGKEPPAGPAPKIVFPL